MAVTTTVIPSADRGKTMNGGRKITISKGDNAYEIVAITGYSPSWEFEYGESFITYSGKEVKKPKGTRFNLSVNLYGLQLADVNALKAVVLGGSFGLSCTEWSGAVQCDSFTPSLSSSNYMGTFYSLSLRMKAVDLEAVSGSL